MAGLGRTCVLALLGAGALVAACGHLPFDEIPLPGSDADAEPNGRGTGNAGPDGGGPADGAVDAGRLADASPADGAIESGAVDAGCAQACVGTFVSGAKGDDKNPGTPASPVRTIGRGMEIAIALGGAQAVYVAAAHYPEKVVLVDGISLFGGFACDETPCRWTRDIVNNDTAILNPDFEGVLVSKTVTRRTLFEGFRVVGKEGSPTGATVGSVALTIAGGSPTIAQCRIAGGDTSGGANTAKRSIGVAILAPSLGPEGALLDRNAISSGTATDDSVGVLFESKVVPPVGSANAVLTGNTIRSGAAASSTGVLASASGSATRLHGNDISSGTSTSAGPLKGSSWGINVSSAMTIDGNRVNADALTAGSCAQNAPPGFCGGLQSVSSTTVITNNVILGGKGPRTCAVRLTEGEKAAGAVTLNGNTLDGAGAGLDGTVSAAIVLHVGPGTNSVIGSVRNNILLGGTNKTRYGVFEEDTPAKTAHLVALDNNDFFNVPAAGKVEFAYRLWNGVAGLDLAFALLPTVTTPVPANNIGADPLLNPTYHLKPGSPCIDTGTPAQAPPVDRDGEVRPFGAGMDIGADEAR